MAKVKDRKLVKVCLEKIADKLDFPANTSYDFNTFATKIKLFPYQEQAVIKAVKILYRYFDVQTELSGCAFLADGYLRYSDYPLNNLSIKSDDHLYSLFANYYDVTDNTIDYHQLLNRMNFWMATGSGKTIVMLKLISIICQMMRDEIIPKKPIMVLAPDDNILQQILTTATKFNQFSDYKLNFVDLKQNWELDNNLHTLDLFGQENYKVYYYKSNNFVADKTEVATSQDGKNIYFDSYRNLSGWYLFLDEAHRGEDSRSKRKALFNILAKNGFLFNFSATFTDDIDILTTIFDMNLAKFLTEGYGKKLYISDTEMVNIYKSADSNLILDNNEVIKQKTIAKTILLLALQRKNVKLIQSINKDMYHMPLMLILAGLVNSEDKGLKPFFNYLTQMVKNEWNIDEAKKELISELKFTENGNYENFKFGLGDWDQINLLCRQIEQIEVNDIWEHVFGGQHGKIEVITFDKNKDEIAFKLKTADNPFALLVIGEAITWLKNDTHGIFEFVNRSVNNSLFAKINTSPDIAILLGSQIFKEGWDSNRPNIICYLGIGKNVENKKYIMQTIGRGIRIEPLPNQRKRFEYCNTDELLTNTIQEIKKLNIPLEIEFIFATESKVINEIWNVIQEQSVTEAWNEEISQYFKINNIFPRELILPKYKNSSLLQNNPFVTSKDNKEAIIDYIFSMSDKVLLLKHNLTLRTLIKLRDKNNIKVSKKNNIPLYKPNYLIQIIHQYFRTYQKVVADFIYIGDQIKHYKHIATILTNNELKQLEQELKQIITINPDLPNEEELLAQLTTETISISTYANLLKQIKAEIKVGYKLIKMVKGIKQLFKHHYYQPILLVQEEYFDKFKHIIKINSEIEFIIDLSNYQEQLNNKYEWWYFTKVDETLDKDIGIGYFDETQGKQRFFYPDFIFWLKEKQTGRLIIKFIDPKGGEHQNNPYDKAVGFEQMFIKSLTANVKAKLSDLNCHFRLCFYNKDETIARSLGTKYKKYWCSNLDQVF